MNTILAAAIAMLLLGACALAPESRSSAGEQGSFSPPLTTRDIGGCPVTVPTPGFVPPEPYPPEPPPSWEQVWYGTPELWTILDRNGAVWRGLPIGKGPHAIGNKTLWFSENFSTARGEDFSGDPEITVTAVDLDGSAPKVVVKGGGVPSFNRDVKNFILVGLGVPELGCWKVTARYKSAELTYVLLVE